MARETGKLTALDAKAAKKRGMLNDGNGLYLAIARNGTKSWILRYKFGGSKKPRHLGLGPLHTVGLAKARTLAGDARRLLLDGVDPIDAKRRRKAAAKIEAAKSMSFDQCAERYIEAHRAGWRNPKHADQWRATIATYASPVFGALPVSAVDTDLVMRVLEPMWTSKTETAARLRGRIESVLDWAAARKLRPEGANPARWRGHLDKLLPQRSKVAPVKPQPALPYAEIGDFMLKLRARDGVGSTALEFAILTATRSNEVRSAEWKEISMPDALWTIPKERMKSGKEHRVPLSSAALAVLKRMVAISRGGDLVFPGIKPGVPLSGNTLGKVLSLMGYDPALAVAHGFRSTFRDWASEQTNFPREVAEMALAHTIDDKVEAAYRRGDLYQKRVLLMKEWSSYCAKPSVQKTANVLPLRG